MHQHESDTGIHMYTPSWISFPFPTPFHPSRLSQSTRLSYLWVKVTQPCLTLCDAMDYTVHGILQARILEWVAFPFSWGSSQPRDRTQISHCRQILYQLSHQGNPELPVSHIKFPLAISFTYDNVYVSILFSQFIPPPPSRTVSTCLFSMFASPLLPCK